MAKLHKVLFHASGYGAWPAIAELGLLTPDQLLGDPVDGGDKRLGATRLQSIDIAHESGHQISIRDQRPMARANIEHHLDGVSLAEWLRLLNQRTFFFARQKDLTTMLGRYQETEGQDVLVFDTARLLAAAKGATEVTTVCSTGPVPWTRCPCRGQDTFVPIEAYRGPVADIEEVTVVGGLHDVTNLVARVIRYHPDRTTEVLVA